MDEVVDEASPEALREAGRLAEAAAAFRQRGDLARAEAIYAELWDFRAAADVARERGDRPAELGHLLAAGDADAASAVGQALERGAEAELRRAAEVYERHRRWSEAAAIRERLGQLPEARELYRRGQVLLEVARPERTLGRLREAGVAYEQLLAREPDGPEAPRAHLELGRLLSVLDRADDAARHLQRATRATDDALRAAALGELAVALDRLGYELAADAALEARRALVPDTPSRRAFLEGHRDDAAGARPRLGGRYEVERAIGAGASGTVFLARDAMSGRAVAVKVLAPRGDERGPARRRFFAETRLVATIRHPHVIEIVEVDEEQGLVVTEHLPGGTLLDRLPGPGDHTPPPPVALVRRVALDLLDGLTAVHARGVVHRDLKPSRLFFTATGQLRIAGFGAAHLQAEDATQTAGLAGTLAYLAPEQVGGGEVGAAADLYSVGVVLFQALTSRLPFPGPDFVAQHLADPAPAPSACVPGLDPAWDGIVAALLQKAPRARPGSIDALRRDVERIVAPDERRRTHDGRAVEEVAAPRPRFVRTSALPDGAGGPIALGVDTRLGRTVAIETLSGAWLAAEAGRAHLEWVRALVRLGGPRLQRLYALHPRDDGGVDLVWEALPQLAAPPSPDARVLLAATLAAAHAAGVAHGSLPAAIVHEAHGPTVRLAGCAPRAGAGIDDDRAALAALG